jgi:hypothetical protein
MRDNAPLKRCECSPDCPKMITSITNIGKPKRYADGHQSKGKKWHIDINGWLCHWCYEVIRDCRKKFGLPTSGY